MKDKPQKLVITIGLLLILMLVTPPSVNGQESAVPELLSFTEDNLSNIELVAEIEAKDTEGMNWVMNLALNSTGSTLAVGRQNGSFELYNLPTLHLLSSYDDLNFQISSIEFSTISENKLVLGGLDSKIEIWDTQSLQLLSTLKGDFGGVGDASFHPYEDVIAFSSVFSVFYPPGSNTVRVWNLETMEEIAILDGYDSRITSIEYNSDGSLLVSGGTNGKLIVWDALEYRQIATIEAHDIWANDIAFNSDGSMFVSVGNDGAVRSWDGTNFALLSSNTEHKDEIYTANFDRSDHLLAVGDRSGKLRILDASSLEELVVFQAHELPITTVIFSKENDFIITGSTDGTARIWGIPSGN